MAGVISQKVLCLCLRPILPASNAFSTAVATNERNCQLLVLGGGAGGCSIASKFVSKLGKDKVIVIEPSDKHYYQPMFTLVGGGIRKLDDTVRPMSEVLPKGSQWIKEKVIKINAKENHVVTDSGTKVNYEYMVVAIGITLNYDKIPGVLEALSEPKSGVCSNYSQDYVEKTYGALQDFKEGNLVFTFPNSPVKCAGAPQKIVYIAENYLRVSGKRKNANLIYNTSLGVLFSVKKYADVLWKICESRGIQVNLKTNLTRVIPDRKVAVFQNLERPESPLVEVPYSVLHVTPPMSAAAVLSSCEGLADSSGFLNVDKSTLQHKVYDNVYGIGDCTNLPTIRTAAAVAAQNGIVGVNLSRRMESLPPTASYDGYTSCPLVTGFSSCILAEFNYQFQPQETFPFNQAKERTSMFHLKNSVMPSLYWNGLLRGHWNGPGLLRNILHGGMKPQ